MSNHSEGKVAEAIENQTAKLLPTRICGLL